MATEDDSEGYGFPVIELGEVDSTNLEAMRRAAAGERGPVWLMAGRQTAGRGRSGRSWQFQAGNLAATLLFAPGCTAADLHQLSLLAGVAVHDAVSGLLHATVLHGTGPGSVRLKWPNDVLADGLKLGGILIESTMVSGDAVAAIGIGVNVAASPLLDDRTAVCLAQLGAHLGTALEPRAVLGRIDARLRHWLEIWRQGAGFDDIRAAWLNRAGPLGEAISVNTGTETIYGVFAGIDGTGALLVGSVPLNPTTFRRFTYGDVSLLPLRDN